MPIPETQNVEVDADPAGAANPVPCGSPLPKRKGTKRGLLLIVIIAVAGIASVWLRCANVDCNSVDYIVVGAGPAGSAVAYHLAGDSVQKKVLVLEAGGPSQKATGGQDWLWMNNLTIFDVPLAWSFVSSMWQYHWDNGNEGLLLAKVIGGCGVHNAMLYVRGCSLLLCIHLPARSRTSDCPLYFR